MLNFVAKSIVGTMVGTAVAKIVHDSYPPIKKECISAYDCVCDFFSLTDSETPTNPIPKGKVKRPRIHLSKHQYDVIMASYELNNRQPKGKKINQQELCDNLNKELGLNYTRSGLAHYFRKRIVPEFEND